MLVRHWTKTTCSPRNVVLASLVLIGAVAAYNWTVAPHRNYLLAAQRYESAADDLAKKSQIISKTVTNKKKQLEELQERFRQIRTRLFDPAEAKEFFSNLQNVSEEANCIVYSLTFSPAASASGADQPEANNYVTAQRATLSVSGDYKSIVTLVNKLQDRSKQVSIDSLRIGSDRRNSDRLKCGMTITIYIVHEEEEHQHG